MQFLIVGDPHAQPKNLADMEKLVNFIAKKAKGVDYIVLMGDQNHFHNVVYATVQNFWLKSLQKLSKVARVVMIRGNHDQSSHQENADSSLEVFKSLENVVVVDEPIFIADHLFVPYYHDESSFKKVLAPASYLWMHQTVDGSQYEGGFYAPDGFSLDLFEPYKKVISGHIHKTQTIRNIHYVGTPKWDTKSDANENKGIWLWDDESDKMEHIPTESILTPIYERAWVEGEEEPSDLKDLKGIVYLNLIGTGTWIASVSKKNKNKYRIVPKPTDSILKTVEKKQIVKSFSDFLKANLQETQAIEIENFVGSLEA